MPLRLYTVRMYVVYPYYIYICIHVYLLFVFVFLYQRRKSLASGTVKFTVIGRQLEKIALRLPQNII